MYTPARVFSQQTQDSKFRMGVLHILAGHSGPETAADGRTHFGIFATQVWKLFPRGQTIHLNFWDYNDVAAGYFAAAEIAARDPKVGIISIEVARPDFPVADRSKFGDKDLKAAAKGFYVIRDFAPGPRHGYVISQGSSSTVNLVNQLPNLEKAGVNVKVIAAISEELYDRQPEAYRNSVLPPEAYLDAMVVSTGTRRVWPVKNLGPLTDEYSLTSDWDNQWLTSGLEKEVIEEAHLDPVSIYNGIERFAKAHDERSNASAACSARSRSGGERRQPILALTVERGMSAVLFLPTLKFMIQYLKSGQSAAVKAESRCKSATPWRPSSPTSPLTAKKPCGNIRRSSTSGRRLRSGFPKPKSPRASARCRAGDRRHQVCANPDPQFRAGAASRAAGRRSRNAPRRGAGPQEHSGE